MAVEIFILDKVREQNSSKPVKKQCDDAPNFVTAINDGQGTFSVKSTFISEDDAASGASITLQGKMSHFGGPEDTTGVKPDEGLAIMDPSDVATYILICFCRPSRPAQRARRDGSIPRPTTLPVDGTSRSRRRTS